MLGENVSDSTGMPMITGDVMHSETENKRPTCYKKRKKTQLTPRTFPNIRVSGGEGTEH